MTAKKMADVFFGNFSNLISSQKTSSETVSKSIRNDQEPISNNKIQKNKKSIIYISVIILLGIAVYFIV